MTVKVKCEKCNNTLIEIDGKEKKLVGGVIMEEINYKGEIVSRNIICRNCGNVLMPRR